MITYFLNWMGPVNKKWIEKHGKGWASGRIDVYGLDEYEYYDGKTEFSVYPMRDIYWSRFGWWLQQQRDEVLPSLQQLVEDFEEETGWEIEWLEVPKWKNK